MNYNKLSQVIRQRGSFLCVGLDPVLSKLPQHVQQFDAPIYTFNRSIIDATAPHCVAFKPNIAFYERYGIPGLQQLQQTIGYIKSNYPEHLVILDAKRADIGNTSEQYAVSSFDVYHADAVTVNPYMGRDSVQPFIDASVKGKWTVILALTSNSGAADFQLTDSHASGGACELYRRVLEVSREWGTCENTMYVIGATNSEQFKTIRQIVPRHFLLIPGIGAQGGDLDTVCKATIIPEHTGILVNASRSIIYASSGEDYAEKAGIEAKRMADEMRKYL